HTPCRSLGLWFSGTDAAHAGQRRRLRPADPARLRPGLPDAAAPARARRRRAPVLAQDRGSPLALAVPAGGPAGRVRLVQNRAPAAGPDQHLPHVQLSHPDRAPGVRAMSQQAAIAFQILQSVFVVIAAPLLTGWVNQCRAWLQNRSAPSILLPYYTLAKLFHKDAVIAHNASRLFHLTPYILFGCMWLAAGIVPVLATGLPAGRWRARARCRRPATCSRTGCRASGETAARRCARSRHPCGTASPACNTAAGSTAPSGSAAR